MCRTRAGREAIEEKDHEIGSLIRIKANDSGIGKTKNHADQQILKKVRRLCLNDFSNTWKCGNFPAYIGGGNYEGAKHLLRSK
jgi:hypothetical protein